MFIKIINKLSLKTKLKIKNNAIRCDTCTITEYISTNQLHTYTYLSPKTNQTRQTSKKK
mgnify:CR=1 FL=1